MSRKYQKVIIFIIVIVFICLDSQSQPLSILWQQCYGGSGNDEGLSVLPSNTGFYLFGQSESFDGDVQGNHGNLDLWLLSVDSSGNFLKSACFGGTDFDMASQMKACPDRGYVLLGVPFSINGTVTNNHGGGDYWIIKTDKDGNLLWQKCFGGSCNDIACDLVVTSDSGFLCSGYSCSVNGDATGNHGVYDHWVIKVDKNSNLQWEKSLGGSSQDNGLGVAQTNDGGAIVVGCTGSADGDVQCQHHSEIDAWVIKLDSAGNIEWQKCYGGSLDEAIRCVIQLDDGSYIFAGDTQSNDGDVSGNHGGFDYWVIKTDHYGNLLWQKCYGGGYDETPTFIKRLSDGNLIIGGYTYSNDGDVTNNHSFQGYKDMWLIKISPDGNLIWQQCFGGTMNETMHDAIELSGQRLLLLGWSSTSNNTGNVQCTHHGPGTDDMWLIMAEDSSMTSINNKQIDLFKISVNPDPARDNIHFQISNNYGKEVVKMKIYNSLGQLIKVLLIPPNEHELTMDAFDLPAGLYYFTSDIPVNSGRGRFILIKSF